VGANLASCEWLEEAVGRRSGRRATLLIREHPWAGAPNRHQHDWTFNGCVEPLNSHYCVLSYLLVS
jgi:hypothetical protein